MRYNGNMRADYVNPKIYQKIYHLLTYENALALRTSLETGLRISDVLKIRVCDLQGRTLEFVAQKTGKGGKKVLSAGLARRWKQISGDNWIFEGRDGTKPRTRQAVWKNVKKAARQLHVEQNLTVHSARKTYAVETFHQRGLGAAQRELQHDRMDNTMLYAFSDLISGGTGGAYANSSEIHEILRLVKDIHDVVCSGCSSDPQGSDCGSAAEHEARP